MLDERASTGLLEIAAPFAAVVATYREELVVSEVGGEQWAKVGRGHQVLQDGEHRRVAQDEANLVDDAGAFDGVHHALDLAERLRERFLTEHVVAPRGFDHEVRVFRCFGTNVDRVQPWSVEDIAGGAGDGGGAGDCRETARAFKLTVADGNVLPGHELQPATRAGFENETGRYGRSR